MTKQRYTPRILRPRKDLSGQKKSPQNIASLSNVKSKGCVRKLSNKTAKQRKSFESSEAWLENKEPKSSNSKFLSTSNIRATSTSKTGRKSANSHEGQSTNFLTPKQKGSKTCASGLNEQRNGSGMLSSKISVVNKVKTSTTIEGARKGVQTPKKVSLAPAHLTSQPVNKSVFMSLKELKDLFESESFEVLRNSSTSVLLKVILSLPSTSESRFPSVLYGTDGTAVVAVVFWGVQIAKHSSLLSAVIPGQTFIRLSGISESSLCSAKSRIERFPATKFPCDIVLKSQARSNGPSVTMVDVAPHDIEAPFADAVFLPWHLITTCRLYSKVDFMGRIIKINEEVHSASNGSLTKSYLAQDLIDESAEVKIVLWDDYCAYDLEQGSVVMFLSASYRDMFGCHLSISKVTKAEYGKETEVLVPSKMQLSREVEILRSRSSSTASTNERLEKVGKLFECPPSSSSSTALRNRERPVASSASSEAPATLSLNKGKDEEHTEESYRAEIKSEPLSDPKTDPRLDSPRKASGFENVARNDKHAVQKALETMLHQLGVDSSEYLK